MRTIYCLELENNRFFLFPRDSPTSNPIQLFLEAVIKYEYIRENKPLAIKNIWEETHLLDLDHHVKKYMFLYGIDQVRGGSYSNPALTPEQRAFLSVELQDTTESFPQDVIKEIIAKYSRVQWSNSEYIKEREHLLEERTRFQKECAILADLRRLDISKVKAELDWLLKYCEASTDKLPTHRIWIPVLNPLINRYRELLPILRDIYTFMTLLERPFDKNEITLKHPQFLLDDFFYGCWREPLTHTKIERVRRLCEAYQSFMTTWENRLVEAEFDVLSWGPYTNERFSSSLTIMDLSISLS